MVHLWYKAKGVELTEDALEAVVDALRVGPQDQPGPSGLRAHPLAESALESALASSHQSSELFADLGRAAFHSVAYQPLVGAVQ